MSNRVIIFDTTLRDGEQAPGGSMTIPEKVKIARQLAHLGVDVIEAGFPISSPAQFEAVQRIVSEVEGPVICALARAMEQDVRAAAQALDGGGRARIHTFIPTSDIHLAAKFSDSRFGETLSEKRAVILRMTDEAVRLARSFTDDVEFSAEDAGRTDPGFLTEVVQVALDAGATTINIPDTTGYCMPAEYASLIGIAMTRTEAPEGVTFSTHCHDDLGLAVANSLAGVRAGARQVECTINGIGERAGNAALEEVVMALGVRMDWYGLETGIDTKELMETSRMVAVCSGFTVQANKAIVGTNAFSHEAGIHQHGVLKDRQTYEIMRAEDVGQKAEQIRLGRHSGRHGLFQRLERLGLPVPGSERDAIYKKFVDLADRKKEVFDEDLYRMVGANDADQRSEGYQLEHLDVDVRIDQSPVARVRIRDVTGGAVLEADATGDGPVDAIYSAIDYALQEAHDLVDYAIRSVTEGSDAQGEVTVVVGWNERFFQGTAVHTDVLQASAQAYLKALNQLVAHRTEEEAVRFVTNGIMDAFQRANGGPPVRESKK